MACLLCDEIESSGEVVFANDVASVVLHNDWSVRGHAMIVARRHVENASQLPPDEWLAFARVWQEAERVLLELTGADRAMILKLGIAVPHLHVHIYPMMADASRAMIDDAMHAKTREERDEGLVEAVRASLNNDNGRGR